MANSDDDDHAEGRVRQALDLSLNGGHVTRDIRERLDVDSHLQACCDEALLVAFTKCIVHIDCGSVSEPAAAMCTSVQAHGRVLEWGRVSRTPWSSSKTRRGLQLLLRPWDKCA